ncbi:MAG: hypothetical protein HY294_10435 [Candidatus Rokubacteria bacterium]|nr:hypothetical protein [Candidatus Rokubacteria bacterium]MBI3826401.1 hypothetical protein [Candidatus Rokubacteria bacterium]
MSRAPAALATAALVLLQLGSGTPLSRSIESIERSVTRPIPQAPPLVVPAPAQVWVPDRYLPVPSGPGTVFVPGHWERPAPAGQFHVPALTVCSTAGGCVTVPAHTAPALELRPLPESRALPQPRP